MIVAKTGPGTLFVVDEKTGERKPYTGEVLATPPEPKGRVAQMLGDVPPSLKQSVAGIGSALVDAGNTLTGGRVDKLTAPAERLLTSEARGIARRLDDYAEAQQGQKSERLQQEEAELAATKGFLPSAKKVLTSPELLVSQIAQQVPILGVTVLGGRGGARVAGQRAQQTVAQRLGAVPEAAAQRFVRRAQVKGAERGVLAAGAGLGGSFAASDAIQQSLDLPEATWDQNDEFRALLAAGLDRDAAKRALAYRAALPAAAIGAGVNLAAGRLTSGLEARALTGQAGVTRDRLLSLEGARSVGSAVARGAAEEAITEGAEQFGANVGTAQIDPAQDLMAGVPEAAGAAAVTGGLLEGGFSAAGSLASRPRRSRAALEAPSAEAPNLGPQLPEVVSEVPEVAPEPPEVAPASPPPTAVQTTTIDPADGPLSKAVALDVAQQTGQPVQPVEVTQPLADPEPPPQNVDPATGEIRPLDQRQVQFLADLGRANGRLPTVAQIVKALGVSAEQAKEARRAALTLLEQQSTPPASSAPTPGGDHVQEGLFQRRGDTGDADRRAAGRPGAADEPAGQGGPQGQEGAQEGGQEEGGQEARAQGVASGEAPAAPAAAEDAAAARQESGDAAVPREGGARTADDLVKIETLYGNTVRVRKQDLDSDRKMLRLYTRDGTPVRGLQSNIHRSQLDPDGSKRAATPGLPYYAVTTKQGDKPFKTERAAMLAVKRARQPEDAYEVRAVEGGFVAVRKPTAAADATRQQAGEPAAPSVAQAGASEASPRELSVPASERGSRSASAGQDAREGEGASSGPSGEASADAVERAARQGGAKPRFTYKVKPGRDGGFIVESDDGGGIVVARKPRGPAILDPVPPRVFKTPELARLFMQKKGLAEAADANVAQAEPNAETSAQSDDGAAQWSTLTPAGRRAALKQAGVDLPDAVLWSHISDANKQKLRPVVSNMLEHATEPQADPAPPPSRAKTPIARLQDEIGRAERKLENLKEQARKARAAVNFAKADEINEKILFLQSELKGMQAELEAMQAARGADPAGAATAPAATQAGDAKTDDKESERAWWDHRPGDVVYARGPDGKAVGLPQVVEEVRNNSVGAPLLYKDGKILGRASEFTRTPPEQAEPAPASDAGKADPFAGNKLFTSAKVAAARERLRKKLSGSQLNSGIDPELLMDGMTIAGAYIEAGVRSFAEYAARMVQDMGDGVKPYLLSFWEAARNYPGLDTEGMTSVEESKRLHEQMLTPEVKAQAAEAIGEVAPKPAKRTRKTGSKADMTLTQDWGVDHINGYGDANRETGNTTKDAFLAEARNYLRAVEAILAEHGYSPQPDRNGRPRKGVSVNEGGAAGSGEVSLAVFNPEVGAGVYVHIGDTALRGAVPVTPSGIAVMFRATQEGDPYGALGPNRWAPTDLSAADLAVMVDQEARRVADEKARASTAASVDVSVTPAAEATPTPNEGTTDGNDSDPARSAEDGESRAEGARAGEVSGAGAGGGAFELLPPAGGSDARTDRGTGRSARRARARAAAAAEGAGDPGGAVPRRRAGAGGHAVDGKPGSRNFVLPVGGLTREGSWLETAKRNVDAIELALTLQKEGRAATVEEQERLAKYTGFGATELANKLFPLAAGQRPEHYNPDVIPEKGWRELGQRLKRLLTVDQLETVMRSTQYAHYTSETVTRGIWSALQRMGFKGGKVLEPGMGHGAFPMTAPPELAPKLAYTGIEMDAITAAIGKQLMQSGLVLNADYTKQKLPIDHFDLAIGNPPFASIVVAADPEYRKHRFLLHDYFFAKTIDRVRPGGILAFVTSAGTMNKGSEKARQYLAERADLLGAIRLPYTAFLDNAGTEVVTDILFLRKRLPGELPAGPAWMGLKPITLRNRAGREVEQLINEYFVDHPEMVLGEHALTGTMYRQDTYNVELRDDQKLEELLAAAVAKLPADVFTPYEVQRDRRLENDAVEADLNPDNRKEGGLYVKDGVLMVTRDGAGKPLTAIEKLTPKQEEWLKDAVALRDTLKRALHDQRTEGDWKTSLKQLEDAYHAFVGKHGRINEFTESERTVRYYLDDDGEEIELKDGEQPPPGVEANERTLTVRRYKNKKLLALDVESPLLMALETETDDGELVGSAQLTRRSIAPPAEPRIESTADALIVSLNRKGYLDIEHVAELAGVPVEQAIDDLGERIYKNPIDGQWVMADAYLSGDVVTALEEAEAAARTDPAYERNVEALKKVQPEPLTPRDITVALGATWLDSKHIEQFAREVLSTAITVSYDQNTGQWKTSATRSSYARKNGGEYSHADRSAGEILDAVLNNRDLRVTRTVREDGKTRTYLDTEATTAVNEIARKMRERFSRWVWEDAARAELLTKRYNALRNRIVPRQFVGDFIDPPGLSVMFKPDPISGKGGLHPHQKRAIWRQIQDGTTYLAHAVGAGKTLEMIIGGMEQKRLGLIAKPMYVVPNHMLGQFATEFLEAYPTANIMVADEETFVGDRRRQFIAAATVNAPDAIIITHSALKKLRVRPETMRVVMDDLIADLTAAIEDSGDGDRTTRKRLEAQLEKLMQRIESKSSTEGKDDVVYFEDIGVDFLYVDEAHEFRKLDFVTNRQGVKGISPQGSEKALDLYAKVRYLAAQRPGRSHVFASGTPVTNTLGELFTVQKFMDYDALRAAGLHHFDAWAAEYGELVTEYERNAAGQYRPVERFAKFNNLPELMMQVRQRMDVLTSSQLGELVKRPDLEGGKPQMVVVEASEALKSYMKDHLAARIEASLNWKPSRDQPHNPDPMLAIIGDARLAVIDMRFVDPTAPNDPNSKLNRMVDEIIARHYEYADLQFPGLEGKGGTQIVFSPIGFGEAVAARRGFDAKAWVNKRLRDAGIPLEQVAWMSDYKTNRQRKALFKEMRAARVRILFGSPANMGTGVNVQNRLRHLHYLSPPWYPSDVEQPHGRILRQGNLNPMVTISWYMTEGTYDATGWGMVARKGRFIEQVMRANRSMRSAEDISEVSSYALASALASGDDRAIRVAELEAKIGRLRNLQGDHERQVIEARTRVHGLQRSIERDTKRLERARAAVEILGDTVVRADGFHLTVGGKPLPGESRADVGMAFVALMRRSIPGAARLAVMGEFEQELARVNDRFPVIVHARPGGGSTVFVDIDVAIGELRQRVLERGELAKLPTEASAALGLTTRMMNAINDVRLLPRDLEQTLQEHERQLEVAKRKSTAPWPEERELYDSVAELERLQAEMAADSAPAPEGGVDSVEDVDFMAALTTAEGERVATSNGVKAAVERLLAAAPNAPRPVFMHGYDGLPARLREGVESRTRQRAEGGRGGKTAALYDPATGQVYLFTDVVTQPDRAVWHVAHEIAGHHGLRSLLGDQLDPALRIADRNPTVASVADAIAKQRNLRSTQRLLAVEEALAELAAAVRTGRFDEIKSRYGVDVPVGIRETVGGTIARFVARLKELLNTLLGREVLKDRDVRLLLEAAWQAADRTGPAGKAAAGLQSRERDTATSDPTQTPEFKRWFGDSKVVDEQGRPLVVYHGTNSDLSAFASDRANYFTADPGAASVYAEGFGAPREGANVSPVYLSIQRPKWMPLTDSAKLTAADLAAIKEEGFDGVFGWVLDIRMGGPTPIAREVGTGQRGMDKIVTEAIPLSPEQIKSAIGNRGTFDPNSPSILESVEAEPNLPLKQRLMSKLETWRPALLGALTLRQLAEVAAPYLPSGKAYVDLVSAMQTRRNVLASEADTIAKEWETLQRQNRRAATAEQRRNRDTDSDRTVDLMHEATIAGVDPAEPYVVSTVVLTSNGDTVRLDPVSGKAALGRLTASMDALKVKGGISETARERELAKLKADHAAVKAGMKEEAARRAAYPTLVARFRALPAEWQALYRKVRDTYAQRSQQTLDALLARIEAMEASDEVKRALTERMRAQFESARVQAPYFPLARFGEFWASLERVGEDGEIERQFLMAETQDERDLLVKRAVAQGWKLGKKGRKIEQIRAQDGASGGFVRDVLDALGEHGVDSRVQDEIYQLYLRTLPDLSMRKHFLHRKKTPGFSTDALRAFAVNAHHTAHQLAKLEYGDRLGRALRAIEQDAKAAQEAAGEDADRASAGAAEFKRRHEWVLNPTGARWVQRALGFNFFFYLGLSPASALVNLTQTAIISYPALAARYGFAKALSETVKAMGQTVRTGGKISKVLQGDELRAWDDLVAMGAIDVTQAHDLAGIGDGSTTDYHAAERRAMELVSLLFHKAEVFNREATGLAAYRLAREAGQSHAEAVKFAADTIWQTHYDYSNANRARFMQGNVAKILLAFKQYAQQTTYYLWRAFYESVRGETPEVKRIARRRLFGTLAMTGVFSGVLGQPLVGMAFWMANIAHALFGDDDEPWDAETEFRNFLADLVPRDAARFLTDGMIEGVFGALGLPAPDISDRTSLSELWFRNPDREMEGRDAWHWMLEQGYGPVLGMLGAGFDGAKLINEGYATGNTEMVKRGIEKMVPKAARDLMKTVRYWGEPPTTLRGDPLLAEAAMSDSVYAALGFTPARLSEQYDINNAAKRYERHVLDRRSVLLDAYAVAHQARDSEGMRAALSQIRAFNRKHGGAAITMKTLRRSLRARQQFREQARGGIRVNPRLREEVDEATRFAEG